MRLQARTITKGRIPGDEKPRRIIPTSLGGWPIQAVLRLEWGISQGVWPCFGHAAGGFGRGAVPGAMQPGKNVESRLNLTWTARRREQLGARPLVRRRDVS